MKNAALQDVRGILFDAGNTLAYPDTRRMAVVAQRVLGRTFAPDDVLRAIMRVLVEADRDPDFLRALMDRAVPANWHLRRAFAALGVEEPELERLGTALDGAHEEKHLWGAANPDAGPVLEELRARGYRLGVISNSEDGQAERLVALVGLLPHFDFCLDSYVFGSAKPDPRIFLHAVERLGTAPGETAYVGDMFMQDVRGSRGAGLHPVLLDPFGLHPEADVTRIRSLRELPGLLSRD